MRLLAAGCFVFGGLLGLVAVGGAIGAFDRAPAWLLGPILSIYMLGLIAVALWLFNPKPSGAFGGKSAEEHLRQLESRGLLDSTEFCVTRAFGVEEFEDEGLHYYLQLADVVCSSCSGGWRDSLGSNLRGAEA